MQYARALEFANPRARIAETAREDLLVMLAKHRRAAAGGVGKTREVERKARQIETAQDRIVNRGNRAAPAEMRKLQRLVGREHRGRRHAKLGEAFHRGFVTRHRGKPSLDYANELREVVEPALIGPEAIVVGQFGPAHRRAQLCELVIDAGDDNDVAPMPFEYAARRGVGNMMARASR